VGAFRGGWGGGGGGTAVLQKGGFPGTGQPGGSGGKTPRPKHRGDTWERILTKNGFFLPKGARNQLPKKPDI